MYHILGQLELSNDIMECTDKVSDIIEAVKSACSLAERYKSMAAWDSDGGAWWAVSVFDMECDPPRLVVTMDAADYK